MIVAAAAAVVMMMGMFAVIMTAGALRAVLVFVIFCHNFLLFLGMLYTAVDNCFNMLIRK